MTLNYNDANRPSDTSRLPGPLAQAYSDMTSPKQAMQSALRKITAETAQIMVSVIKTLRLRESQYVTDRCLTGPRELENFLANGERTSVKLPYGSVIIGMDFTNPGILRLEYQFVMFNPTPHATNPEMHTPEPKFLRPSNNEQQAISPINLIDLVYGPDQPPLTRNSDNAGPIYSEDYVASASHTQGLAWTLMPLLTEFAGNNGLRLYTGFTARETLEYIFIDGER